MRDEEKKLIENLFYRLKNTELNSSERDNAADELIRELVIKQPASSYYMVQTILIQETAIKKMSIEIEELKKRINKLSQTDKNSKPSFLSNLFKNNSISKDFHPEKNIWKNQESVPQNRMSNPVVTPAQQNNLSTNTRSSGFLSNALQTAAGVAGGMIMGNMIMNLFHNTKPEEEIFDTINHDDFNHHIDDNMLNDNNINDTLINYEQNDLDTNLDTNIDESSYSDNILDVDDSNNFDDMDVNDDNFI